MARNIQVQGTFTRTIESVYERYVDDPKYENARFNGFEKVAGVSPKEAVEAIVSGAAEKCRIKNCELTTEVKDQIEVRGGFGIPPNEIEAHKDRDVNVTVTCPRSCSRQACQSVISRATKTVESLFDEVAGGVIGPAKEAHMGPAEQRAGGIRAAADAEAEDILAAARGELETVGAQVMIDFRERYNLAPPAAE